MTEQIDEKAKVRPWQWPGEWMKDENFWKDVASRTVSGLLVVILGLLYAGAAGYITSPDVRGFLVGLAIVVVTWTFTFIFVAKCLGPPAREAAANKDKRGIVVAIAWGAILTVFCVFMVFVAIVVGTLIGR